MKKFLTMALVAVLAFILVTTSASAEMHRDEMHYDPDVGNILIQSHTEPWAGENAQVVAMVVNDWKEVSTVVNLERYSTSSGWYFVGTRQHDQLPDAYQDFVFNPYPVGYYPQGAVWRFQVKMYSKQTGTLLANFHTKSFVY
jgi:hypothetical protein